MADDGERHDPTLPPPAEGNAKGLGLSVLVHGGLLAALAWGVNWRSPPVEVSAELWSAVPMTASSKFSGLSSSSPEGAMTPITSNVLPCIFICFPRGSIVPKSVSATL